VVPGVFQEFFYQEAEGVLAILSGELEKRNPNQRHYNQPLPKHRGRAVHTPPTALLIHARTPNPVVSETLQPYVLQFFPIRAED